MGYDINDAAQAGVDPRDILDATAAQAPVVAGAMLARMGAQGLTKLDKAARALTAIGEREAAGVASKDEARRERGEVFAKLGGGVALEELAAAYRVRASDVERRLRFGVRTLTGCATLADGLLSMVKGAAQAQEDSAAAEAEQRKDRGGRSATLTKWLRELGIRNGNAWRVPDGWEINEQGLWTVEPTKDGDKVTRVMARPLLVLGAHRDIEAETTQIEIAWKPVKGESWVRKIVPRQLLASRRAVVALADEEADVADDNALLVVRWARAWEAQNRGRMEIGRAASRMGWLGHRGSLGFMLGHKHYGAGETPDVRFVAAPEMERLAAGWRTRGSWDEWCGAIAEGLAGRPLAVAMLVGACAAPFLMPLGKDNGFVVALDGDSGGGKSTALQVAASAWGDPAGGAGVFGSWNVSSVVGVEERFKLSHSLPVLLDETKLLEGKYHIATEAIYMAANGHARTRGKSEGGLRDTATWLTCLLSTGELPMAQLDDQHHHGGAVLRTVSLRGMPMGAAPKGSPAYRQQYEEASALSVAVKEHHGHLGERVIGYLIEQRGYDGWAGMRARQMQIAEELMSEGGEHVEARIVSSMSIMLLVAEVIFEAIGVPKPVSSEALREELWRSVRTGVREADAPRVALEQVYRWCAARQARFWAPGGTVQRLGEDGTVQTLIREPGPRSTVKDGRDPATAWAGRWSADHRWEAIYITTEALEEVLKKRGMSWAAVRSAWKARDYIEMNGSRMTLSKRIDGPIVPVVGLRRSAIEALDPSE